MLRALLTESALTVRRGLGGELQPQSMMASAMKALTSLMRRGGADPRRSIPAAEGASINGASRNATRKEAAAAPTADLSRSPRCSGSQKAMTVFELSFDDVVARGLVGYLRGPACRCERRSARYRVVYIIAVNGVRQYRLRCCCGNVFTDPIAFAKLDTQMVEQAEIIAHNRTAHRCARCGSSEVEEHHWAPVGVFDDFDQWPTAWLCRRCHQRWARA